MVNINKTKFFVSISSFLILIVISGCAKTPIQPKIPEKIVSTDVKTENEKIPPKETPATSPIKLTLSVSPINEEKFAEVTLTVKSERSIQDASGKIILPEAYELVEGNLEWKTDLQANELEVFKLKVKSVKEGDWVIKATTDDKSASAQVITKISPENIHYTYINASEFYKDKVCAYSACYGVLDHCFKPEPRKGIDSINYFKSLNLTDDYIYGMMQFETLDCDPTKDQMNILAADNITLFEYYGEHTYYAKIPKTILETKSYDFVRWIGIAENASWKVDNNLRNKTFGKNCSGYVELMVNFYQNVKDIPNYQNKLGLILNLSKNVIRDGSESVTVNASVENIYKIASFNFVQRIWGGTPRAGVLGGYNGFVKLPDPLQNIKCTD